MRDDLKTIGQASSNELMMHFVRCLMIESSWAELDLGKYLIGALVSLFERPVLKASQLHFFRFL